MDRIFKTPEQLIDEGYNSEAALVFLGTFFMEEKKKQMDKIMACPLEELPLARCMYKYICGLETMMKQKVDIGIRYATEQPQ
mgnify:CR=1 FL=1